MQKILIVDDDEMMRGVIKANLDTKYEVIDTGAPETALALTLEHRPDAILFDLAMPGFSGFELCRALSSLTFTQQIPVLILSGQDEKKQSILREPGCSRLLR